MYYHFHFMDRERMAKRGVITCPRSPSKVMDTRFYLRSVWSQVLLSLNHTLLSGKCSSTSSWCFQRKKLFLVVASGGSLVSIILAAFLGNKWSSFTGLEKQTFFSLMYGRGLVWRSEIFASGFSTAINQACGFVSSTEKRGTLGS